MKTKLIFLAIFTLITIQDFYSQVDYSKPMQVAQGFLDLYLAGKPFEACKLYGTADCEEQISALVKQLVERDIPLINKTCNFVVDSCKINLPKNTAECRYIKSCEEKKMDKNGILTLRFIDGKWLVEYTWSKNKLL